MTSGIFHFRECNAQDSITDNDVAASWVYRCNFAENKCIRTLVNHPIAPQTDMSLAKCKLICGSCGRLWPKPNEG